MDFKELKEKCFGKDIGEIKEVIKDNKLLKKVENIDIVVRAINIARQILNLEHSIDFFYIFQKYFLILINEIDLFLEVENVPTLEKIDFSDYDAAMQEVLENIPSIRMFKDMIEDVISSSQFDAINELRVVLEDTNISNDDLERAEATLNNMFSNQSDERLKLIESILAYNDPNIKNIKDFIYNPEITVKQEKTDKVVNLIENRNKEKDEAIKAVENIKNIGNKVTEQINSMEPVEAVNNQLKEEQLK